jgi:hypothetical protein
LTDLGNGGKSNNVVVKRNASSGRDREKSVNANAN